MEPLLRRSVISFIFLFVLFTTSLAETYYVCVKDPEDRSLFAVFYYPDNTYVQAGCYYENGSVFCCGEINRVDRLTVQFWMEGYSREVEIPYRLVYGDGFVKLVSASYSTINIYGEPESVVVVEENVPKDNVVDAEYIETQDGLIYEFDPVIRWYVKLDEEGRGKVYYRVVKGSVPLEGTVVRLASCSIDIKKVDSTVLRDGEKLFLSYEFEVLDSGERVIPLNVKASVNNRPVSLRYSKTEKTISFIEQIPRDAGSVNVYITVKSGDCEKEYSEQVFIENAKDVFTPFRVAPYLVFLALVVAVFLIYRRLHRSS